MSEDPLYQPLLPEETRLLTITSIDPTIECLLKVCSLSKSTPNWQPYNALSYVWGSQPFSETISCNGIPLKITPSLFDTLKEIFRYNEVDSEERPVWIDAICLNQKDSWELGFQVPLMRDIYSKATIVLVYLGSAQNNSDLAMQSAAAFMDKLHEKKESSELISGSAWFPSIRDPIWSTIEHLLARPWFHRVWTLQEVVLGKEIKIGCGSVWLQWEVLADLFEELRMKGLSIFVDNFTAEKAAGASAIAPSDIMNQIGFIRWFRAQYGSGRRLDIQSLLSVCRLRECKEPVDHLWGILGLLPSEVSDKVRSSGMVDYTPEGRDHFWNSYITFSKWLIQDSLQHLSTAASPSKHHMLPSWCPDWASMQSNALLPAELYGCGAGNMEHGGRDRRTRADSNKIYLSGFRIDTIDQVIDSCPAWDRLTFKPEKSSTEILQWASTCHRLSEKICRSNDMEEALARTLVGNVFFDRESATTNICTEDQKRNYQLWIMVLGEIAYREARYLSEAERLSADIYFGSAKMVCRGRAFFSTSGGRIGLGPPNVKKGDLVCVFYSGDPLFIIRFKEMGAEGDDAELVGEAYVHGLMEKGQAFESSDRGKDEEFVLV